MASSRLWKILRACSRNIISGNGNVFLGAAVPCSSRVGYHVGKKSAAIAVGCSRLQFPSAPWIICGQKYLTMSANGESSDSNKELDLIHPPATDSSTLLSNEPAEADQLKEDEKDDDNENFQANDFMDPLEAQLQGVPRRMQRFLLQKMLKMKPTEAENVSHFKRQFQMRVIDVNRTCKVTKGGGILGFTALVVCGNGNGAVGFGKGKSAEVAAAVDKAYARSLRNLHYFERFDGRTTFHPVVAKYERTKVYLWPGRPGSGMKAGGTVGGILRLAGFKDVKSKVIGSRNPHNTVKATFKALSMVEIPPEILAMQDTQQI